MQCKSEKSTGLGYIPKTIFFSDSLIDTADQVVALQNWQKLKSLQCFDKLKPIPRNSSDELLMEIFPPHVCREGITLFGVQRQPSLDWLKIKPAMAKKIIQKGMIIDKNDHTFSF